jgi:hypothetical protein
MKARPGCCGHCDGFGSDPSAPETGGLCWDCRGTGHPHLGPCGGWERFAAWCHRQELNALSWTLGWAWVSTFFAVLPGAEPWAIYIVAVPVLLGIPAWIAMSRIGDRQTARERQRTRQ